MIADVDVFEIREATGEGPSVILALYEAAFLTVAKKVHQNPLPHLGSPRSSFPTSFPHQLVRRMHDTQNIIIINKHYDLELVAQISHQLVMII